MWDADNSCGCKYGLQHVYDDITPTAAGAALGITYALDVCCGHNVFTSFPAFLGILATNAKSLDAGVPAGLAAVIGGEEVIIMPFPATLVLLGVGLGCLAARSRSRTRRE